MRVAQTGWDQMPKHVLRLNTDTEPCGLGERGAEGVPLEDVSTGARVLLGRDPESLASRALP